ncbi:MAG: UDP-N-acetylmuramate--L-alanine ligase [Leptospiraceae bacterium]|nr:UDP-N-acetylmuramate--L-alanine ligase [Leptospiraceae bacterium]
MNLLNTKTVFFIGIGGSGMSSLAHILLDMGLSVHGTDKKESSRTIDLLKKRGMKFIASSESLIPEDYDFCVYSSAVSKDKNEFYRLFADKNILLQHRSEVLHTIFSQKKAIAVTGSHGKTSTTTMIAQILLENGLKPTVMIGGETSLLGGVGGCWGDGEWGVYESDESDGTFLNHRPQVKIITNIDDDHLDYYKTRENLLKSFTQFIKQNQNSISILNLDDMGVGEVLKNIENKTGIVTYTSKDILLPIEKINFQINNRTMCWYKNEACYQLELPIPGIHYLKNALAALLACEIAGVSLHDGIQTLKSYKGVHRRLEYLGCQNNIHFYDDYGHHPTEILTVIESLRQLTSGSSRLAVIFQPHRYTRTRDLYDKFAYSLGFADTVFLLPVYSAGEEEISGISSKNIYNSAKDKSKFFLMEDGIERDAGFILDKLSPGDFLVSIGAGNVRDWCEKIISILP